jgi:hypothetical protein
MRTDKSRHRMFVVFDWYEKVKVVGGALAGQERIVSYCSRACGPFDVVEMGRSGEVWVMAGCSPPRVIARRTAEGRWALAGEEAAPPWHSFRILSPARGITAKQLEGGR